MSILSQAPTRALRIDLAAHNLVVRARLERLGITAEDIRRRIEPKLQPVSGSGSVWEVILVVVGLLGLVCLVLGVVTGALRLFDFVLWALGWE